MTDYETLKGITDEIESLIKQGVTSESPSFITWHTKAKRFLKRKYGEKSEELASFNETLFTLHYYTYRETHTDFIDACVSDLKKTQAVFEAYLEEMGEVSTEQPNKNNKYTHVANGNKVFIVHGHNAGLKEALARLLEKQGIEPVILSEQANGGKTIIEKFEENSDVSAAICLFTADDEGKAKAADGYKPRARQNVIFEAGYFAGKLGRDRLMILADKYIEIPSDLQGIVYSDTNSWQFEVLKELKIMGFSIDLNKLVV